MTDDTYYDGGLTVETYDIFYEQNLGHSPVSGDVAFYVERARAEGGRVLELAVGTGRIAVPLAQGGCEVTGVDLSAAMLAVARKRIDACAEDIARRITLVEAGMEDFNLDQRFDIALIPFRSFHHVATAAGQRRTLENVRKHLKPGGLLIIDIFDADLATVIPGAASPAQPREITDPATGLRVRRTSLRRENDPFAQLIREFVRVETFDASGAPVAVQDATFSFRWATYNEMACMLECAGFTVETCFGDFQGGPPGYKREQIWLARA